MSVEFWINIGVLAGIYGIFVLGLQLNAGLTGLPNFGQAGFMAIGAYGAGLFVVIGGLSLWLSCLAAVALAVVVGLLVGFVTSRLQSDHFAIATIAFAEIVRLILQNAEFSGGNQGVIGYDDEWRRVSEWLLVKLGLAGADAYVQLPLLIAAWTTLFMLLAGLEGLRRTPWARVLRGIREDEGVTAALGKNTISYRMQSLGIAAALAATAGIFVALNVSYLYPSIFDPAFTFLGYSILLLTGLGSFCGVAMGSIIFWVLVEGSRLLETSLAASQQASLRFILVGISLVLLSRWRPEGLFGNAQEMRAGR